MSWIPKILRFRRDDATAPVETPYDAPETKSDRELRRFLETGRRLGRMPNHPDDDPHP